MIVQSKGLDVLNSAQISFLSHFLGRCFKDAYTENMLSSMNHHRMEQFFFIKNNKPVAVVSFKKKGSLNCTYRSYSNVLYNVATAPYYRKRGYMKQLLQHIMKVKTKLKYLHLEVLKKNKRAINLYQKLGFHVVDDPCVSDPDIFFMRLVL